MNFLKIRNICYCVIVLILFIGCDTSKKDGYTTVKSNEHTAASFVGSQSCKSCHEKEYNLWEGSHHEKAMKIADATSVLGDFNNTVFNYKGVKTTFYKKNGAFYVNTTNEKGIYKEYKIKYTFGFTPLQQYIVEFPNGAYNCLLVSWDSVEKKWFRLQSHLELEDGEWINWTGGSQRWNTMCADCHSTNLHKNYNSKTQVYNTTFSEISVGCEACHGPLSAHNSFYKNQEKNPDATLTPPKMYMGSNVEPKDLVDKCARCHSRRGQLTKYFDYKGTYKDHYLPRLIESPIYELDGQILDEVYVYGSFIQSKMYASGISCKDCHDVHSMKLKKKGNDLCLTCHEPKYNTPKHHFHKVDTKASLCINCHMTGKTYMENDFRRDHSFRIPRPDQSEKYGTPNACTGCHTDKTDKWASDVVIEKYGKKRADHFSDHLLKGYFEDPLAFKTLFSNTKYPEIARATALSQYSNQPLSKEAVSNLLVYLKDSSALVRNTMVQVLERTGNQSFSKKIEPLLKDSIRGVRLAAARYFIMANLQFNDKDSLSFKKASKEFMTELEMSSDFSSGLTQMALYYQQQGEIDLAIEAYKKSLIEDNRNNRSRMNLALIYYQQGLPKESEKLYLKVILQEPEFGYSYYMLGLLYNETGAQNKAIEYLKLATEKQPININAFYNYILILQQADKQQKSIQVANNALKLAPNNERILYVKLIGQLNINSLEEAYKTGVRLLKINPNNKDYRKIVNNIIQQNK